MNLIVKWLLILAVSVFGFLFFPLLAAIGLTVGGSFLYVRFMVKNNKAKPKRKTKPATPEPKKEEPKLKMEDFPIA